MNILLIGSGGRENAFARQISLSKHCQNLFITPGNPGTAEYGENVEISSTDFPSIKSFVLQEKVDMVIVGPEAPLVEGIFDYFINDDSLKDIPVIGPSQQGAMLEGSKAYSKAFMVRHGIPTAGYQEFTNENLQEGLDYIATQTPPIVLKADGLAAGKGVLICPTIEEAQSEFQEMLGGKFGSAGSKVVIEEFMTGLEYSVFVLSDGKNYQILPIAKDYKRIGEGDAGLNTGGMGAVSPPPFVTQAMMQEVEQKVIIPTIEGLQKDEIIYKGFIYIGLMNTPGDIPKVVEYNCRMGDPETQAVLPRIESDFLELMQHTANETLDQAELIISEEAAVTVILASGGYPEDFEKGFEITAIDAVKDAIVFHAGTLSKDDKTLSNGGRVLAVTSLDKDWLKALEKSNQAAATIQYQGKYYRKDIGFDLK
ncbi:MAG TPA: phosphoribosylamine--glycine ligase [Chitinophagales bacterium]|nr:phosphoribosylamine--glycine ligase [Chitinophagales bacterium]